MMTQLQLKLVLLGFIIVTLLNSGCSSSGSRNHSAIPHSEPTLVESIQTEKEEDLQKILPVNFETDGSENLETAVIVESSISLTDLESLALNQNPKLVRLYREYNAATSRARYVDKLPDPKVGANVFVNPIETASGSQRANINVSQVIPWIGRLNAQEQQASFEAMAVRAEYMALRLDVLSKVRTGWYRIYIIDKQIKTTEANQELLKTIINLANARVATGNASQGDVLLGTLELSQLEERILTYHRQRKAVQSELNRLVSQSANTRINNSEELSYNLPDWTSNQLHQIALTSQPEIDAARLRTQATRWGIEIARLSRRPEFMFSANYFLTDSNRPSSNVVNVGEDPFSLGAQVSIPIWKEKYQAMKDEATWKHFASHETVNELNDKYDSIIVDLLAEVRRAYETANLYKETILPQAQQTLQADQDAYINGTVEFDRVVKDYRSLLTLELVFHRAVGELAIAISNIYRATGKDIPLNSSLPVLP